MYLKIMKDWKLFGVGAPGDALRSFVTDNLTGQTLHEFPLSSSWSSCSKSLCPTVVGKCSLGYSSLARAEFFLAVLPFEFLLT